MIQTSCMNCKGQLLGPGPCRACEANALHAENTALKARVVELEQWRALHSIANGCNSRTTERLGERAEKAEARVVRLREALSLHSACRVIHQGYREGATCRDVREVARLAPADYGAAYRSELLSGAHLCAGCQAAETLTALSEETP